MRRLGGETSRLRSKPLSERYGDFSPAIQKPSANLVAPSTLIWVGNSYCDAAVSKRPRLPRNAALHHVFGGVQSVPLLQCDQDLDYTISFREWLQRFAHNSSSHPVSISSLHCIACFVGRNQEIARSNVSVFSCDFTGNDSYNRERNIRFRRLVHFVGTREHARLGGIDASNQRRIRFCRTGQTTIRGVINHQYVSCSVEGSSAFHGKRFGKVSASRVVGSCENVSGILYPKHIVDYARSVRHGSTNNQLSATVVVIFLENSSRATGRIDSRKKPDAATCAASSDRRRTRRSYVTQQPDSIGALGKAMDADPSAALRSRCSI